MVHVVYCMLGWVNSGVGMGEAPGVGAPPNFHRVLKVL